MGLASALAGLSAATARAAEGTDAASLFAAARSAMAGRDLAGAEARLQEAAQLRLDRRQTAELNRLQEIHELLGRFWQAVDRGARSLQATETMEIDGKPIAIVEFTGDRLIIRSEGRNLRYTAQTVPGKIVLALAERSLDAGAPQNLPPVAAFLIMDSMGKRELAGQLLNRTGRLPGVESLREELDVPRAAPPLTIPPLTPIVRMNLKEENWRLQTGPPGRPKRVELGEHVDPSTTGYLSVQLPQGAQALLYNRRYTGNFGCRAIVKDPADGVALCAFDAETGAELARVPLPPTTCKAEFARVRGEFVARINDEEVKVQTPAGAAVRNATMIGFTCKPSGRIIVAWLETQGS
jgi:hypothetical protein